VQTANVLLDYSLPANRKCQKKCVESGVIKPFSNEFSRGEEDRSTGPLEGIQRPGGSFLFHPANQERTVFDVRFQPCFQQLEMALPFGKDQRYSPFLDRLQHITRDELVPVLVFHQDRVDLVDRFFVSFVNLKGRLASDQDMLEPAAATVFPNPVGAQSTP
jgi:hypothetical protein